MATDPVTGLAHIQERRSYEKQLHGFIDTANDAIFVIGVDATIRDVNRQAQVALEYSREELIGRSCFELVLASDQIRARKSFHDLVRQRRSIVHELHLVARNGEVIEYDFSSSTLEGDTPLILAIGRDMTERRRMEKQLDESRRRMQRIVEASPAAVYSVRLPDFVTTFVSDNIQRQTGYPGAAFIADPHFWLDRVHPEDRARVMADFSQIESRKRVVTEYRFGHADGSWRWMRDEAAYVPATAESPAEAVGSWFDITERVDTEERLRAILENAPILVYAKDREGRYLFVNRQCESSGFTVENFVGKTDAELLSSEVATALMADDRRVLETGEVLRCHERVPTPRGLSTFESIKFPLRDAGGRVTAVCGISTDVTERLTAEENHRKTEDMLRQAQKMEAVGRLAGGVAHDFNNLLTVINGYSDLLLERKGETPETVRELQEIHDAGLRAANLTRQLLTFSRQQSIQPAILDPAAVLKDMEKLLKRLLGEDVQLQTRLSPRVGPVFMDRGQLEQIFMNLAVNARDAMPRGGRLILQAENIEVGAEGLVSEASVPPGNYVRFNVADTGVGMSPEIKSRLFEPFFTTKEPGKGTGLGLATVHGIVTQAGGRIWVFTDLGKGSTFTFCLPLAGQNALLNSAAPDPRRPVGGTETILVAEDDAPVRHLISEILRNHGYKVLEAQDGAAGLDVARGHAGSIDLLLTDLVMPRMGGTSLSSSLHHARPGISTLFMTGFSEIRGDSPPIKSTDQLLLKPFTPGVLLGRVRETLNRIER